MREGSIATLEDALAHCAAGGRTIASGPNRGIGRHKPNRNHAANGFALTGASGADLVPFLRSLTDDAVLHDPWVADPWPHDAAKERR
jgi:cytochrome c peroxidase